MGQYYQSMRGNDFKSTNLGLAKVSIQLIIDRQTIRKFIPSLSLYEFQQKEGEKWEDDDVWAISKSGAHLGI